MEATGEVTADGILEGHGGGALGRPAILVSERRNLSNFVLRVKCAVEPTMAADESQFVTTASMTTV